MIFGSDQISNRFSIGGISCNYFPLRLVVTAFSRSD